LYRPPTGRRPPDVRHEGRGLGLLGFADEFPVAERRCGLFVEHGLARRAEEAQAGAIGVAVALRLQRIGASSSQNVALTRACPRLARTSGTSRIPRLWTPIDIGQLFQ